MDNHLPRLYKDYGEYSNYRNFPSSIDGLKPVERRVLLSAYKIARDKLVKSRQVDAYAIGHYHPHGECYGTIVQMVRQGFLIGQGNFGSNVGVDVVGAAAPRYTECKMHPKTIELAFKYVKHVPWVDTELNDKEPLYLPTLFPVCLIGLKYTEGIGFGFKTYIPCYTMDDLYKRLLWLIGHRKRKPTIAPITDCKITSDKEVLEKLLTTGKAKIDVEGIIEVNKKANMVSLKSWPPGKKFVTFLNKFSSELSDNMIGFTDLSVNETNIVFQVVRERNRDKIFDQFLNKLRSVNKGSISFETIVVDENNQVQLKSIDNMLLETYNKFCKANEEMLRYKVNQINTQISEYEALIKIRPIVASAAATFLNIDSLMKDIKEQTDVPVELAQEIINKYKIKKLLTIDVDTKELHNLKKAELKNLAELDSFVLNQYVNF
jgi:DNA gyrase/topoisomerase IV subunit A